MVGTMLSRSRVPMGPYELDEAIGVGGMGQVWSATHRESGALVAIKVLTAFAASNKALRSAFRNEIRACAALNHPTIVQVLDRGEVPEAVERMSQGQLRAGTPYLVMEYVGGGSLDDWCGHPEWREVKMVLLGVLDALAHAHARGLIHRDIKPANILLTETRDAIRLTDFGLVHAVETTGTGNKERGMAGTPRYMAPEQCLGRWRDYGPWTDFYALGGVGYALAAGVPPFADIQAHFELMRAQRERPMPRLESKTEIPDGFEGWLRRMMAKRPEDRFPRASEAAAALQALGEPASYRSTASGLGLADDTAETLATDSKLRAVTLLPGGSKFATLLEGLPGVDESFDDDFSVPATDGGLPSISPEWMTIQGKPTPVHALTGASLGLYWLRPVPLVNREYEREQLWSALRDVRDNRRARVVVLQGGPGVGKTRLAEWLCYRAHEIGGCDYLRADPAESKEGGSGLAAMLARRFRTLGLPFAEVVERIDGQLRASGHVDPEFARAIAELVHPNTDTDELEKTRPNFFDTKWEKLRIVQLVLERLSSARPQIVWLENAHRSGFGLHLVRETLREQEVHPTGTLMVVVVQPDRLAERPVEAELLREIVAHDATDVLSLEPLLGRDHQTLVRRLLRLSGELALWVEERTAGNPQFAVQMVGDWVDRGLLEPTLDGFVLKPGAEVTLPPDLAAVWTTRLQSFLEKRGVHDAPSLELAAVYGREIDERSWWALCNEASLTPGLDLLDNLLDEGLARAGSGGPAESWAFAHSMVRQTLLDRAAEAGRLNGHHRACAHFEGFRGGPGASERIARHLVEAGELAQALGPLAQGAWELVQAEELARAQGLLESFEKAVTVLDLAPNDARRGQALLLRVRLAARSGKDSELESWAAWARAEAQAQGWEHIDVYVTYELASRKAAQGLFDEAGEQLERVAAWADAHSDRPLLGRCLHEMGLLAAARGDNASARLFVASAARHFEQMEEGVLAARAMLALATLEARAGNSDKAEAIGKRAQRQFARSGSRVGPAEAALLKALSALLAGDLAAAIERYRAAANRFEALGSQDSRRAEAGLGLALSLQERFGESEPLLVRSLERCEEAGARLEAARVRVGLLAPLAARAAWDEFDLQIAALQALSPRVRDVELQRALQIARRHAMRHLETERAEAAWAFVVE